MTANKKKLVEEIKLKLIECVNNTDTEYAHANADALLIELLNGLGLKEVTDIYKKVKKWYA